MVIQAGCWLLTKVNKNLNFFLNPSLVHIYKKHFWWHDSVKTEIFFITFSLYNYNQATISNWKSYTGSGYQRMDTLFSIWLKCQIYCFVFNADLLKELFKFLMNLKSQQVVFCVFRILYCWHVFVCVLVDLFIMYLEHQ